MGELLLFAAGLGTAMLVYLVQLVIRHRPRGPARVNYTRVGERPALRWDPVTGELVAMRDIDAGECVYIELLDFQRWLSEPPPECVMPTCEVPEVAVPQHDVPLVKFPRGR